MVKNQNDVGARVVWDEHQTKAERLKQIRIVGLLGRLKDVLRKLSDLP